MRYLSVEEALVLHDYQIERFGGSHGILSLPLLESAVSRPKTNVSGSELYKGVFHKAAVLAFSIIKNHPFTDGNKRTGLYAAIVFIELNGYKATVDSIKLVRLGVDVANGSIGVEKLVSKFIIPC